MTTLLLASRNAHKTREFTQLLGPDFFIADLTSRPTVPETIEFGRTFEENAAIKAVAISRIFPAELVFADDSGLEVKVLGGAPGIYSARYAGEHATDKENMEKLVREVRRAQISGTAGQDDKSALSQARFRCVIALARNAELVARLSGDVSGFIISSGRGANGFGYDPIFVPRGYDQTFAQLPAKLKNRISHRACAARKLSAFVKAALRE